jgi:hypothetical protein
MADFKTTSYQADLFAKEAKDREQEASIYYKLPDQFLEYENKSYNPIDFLTSSGEFNIDLINKSYREEQLKRMEFFRQKERERLETDAKLNKKPLPLTQLTIGQHLDNFSNTFYNIISDTTKEPLNTEIITKDNRLFYIGIFLLILFIIYAVLSRIQIA